MGIDHRLVGGIVALLAVGAIVFVVIVGKGTGHSDGREGRRLPQGDTRQRPGVDRRHRRLRQIARWRGFRGAADAGRATIPGQSAIEEYQNKCEPELASYAPDAITDDSVQLYVLYPTAETWEQGDRAVTCVATLDPPRTGSLKG